ncbi:hypothetical protein [Streptomyces sp. KL116D]|uniref:hypothetical protein n=1 Tax=Streptomyces sp. KL116D TaxID=3045152 RepID=UPI00355760BF
MTGQHGLIVTGVLTIDAGQGYEDKETGQIHYRTPPRAKYECGLCLTREGPVYGVAPVRDFVREIRTGHRARCRPATTTATQHQQGAQAA